MRRRTLSHNISPQFLLEELARLPLVVGPVVSHGQNQVAYFSNTGGRMELYVQDMPGGRPRQLSHGQVPRTPYSEVVWNRAGTAIVFGRDIDGNEQHDLFRIEVADGAVTRLTEHPDCLEYPIAFSPDDVWLLVAANRGGQLNLWRLRPDGSEYRQLTYFRNPIEGGQWSHDSQRIAFTVNESADLRNADGYVMAADGGGYERVFRVREGTEDRVIGWSPDDRLLAVASNASGFDRAGLLDTGSNELRWLTEEGVDGEPVRFSRDGRWLLCRRSQNCEVRPVLYDVESGCRRDLRLPPGFAANADFALGDSAILIQYTTETRRSELLLYSLVNDVVESLAPANYGNVDPEIFVAGEQVWFPSQDGRQIPAILYRPHNISADVRLPAIIDIHGGPTSQWFRFFYSYVQARVAAGYVVLLPNIRGSTGYGDEFREAARFDWGGADLEDIVAGVAYLVSLRYVDPQRLAIVGVSYGGFMTYLATVKHPGLWKAAVAKMGITDLRRLYDSSMEHFKYFLRSQMGDPDENAALWADRSPANFAASLRAKLLILHGVNDPRCPVDQARYFRDRLLAAGKRQGEDFGYVELGAEGHGSTDVDQRLREFRLESEFLDRTL